MELVEYFKFLYLQNKICLKTTRLINYTWNLRKDDNFLPVSHNSMFYK